MRSLVYFKTYRRKFYSDIQIRIAKRCLKQKMIIIIIIMIVFVWFF